MRFYYLYFFEEKKKSLFFVHLLIPAKKCSFSITLDALRKSALSSYSLPILSPLSDESVHRISLLIEKY